MDYSHRFNSPRRRRCRRKKEEAAPSPSEVVQQMIASQDPELRAALVQRGSPYMLFYEGFDDCIVGVTHAYGVVPRVTYDGEQILRTLTERLGLSPEAAAQVFNTQILGANMGPYSPAILTWRPVQDLPGPPAEQ